MPVLSLSLTARKHWTGRNATQTYSRTVISKSLTTYLETTAAARRQALTVEAGKPPTAARDAVDRKGAEAAWLNVGRPWKSAVDQMDNISL